VLLLRIGSLSWFICAPQNYQSSLSHYGSISGPLMVPDLQGGTLLLLRLVQRSHLWDIKSLQSKGLGHSSSTLASHSPFNDKFGLLRVDGQLSNSSLDFNGRHLIILQRSRSVTIAFIAHYLQTWPRALLGIIRFQYWPIGGWKTVMKAVNKCIRCFRLKPGVVGHFSTSQRCEASLQ